jgi:hypothetical protein
LRISSAKSCSAFAPCLPNHLVEFGYFTVLLLRRTFTPYSSSLKISRYPIFERGTLTFVLVRFVSIRAESWKEMQKHCSCFSCNRAAAGASSVKISRYPIFEGGTPTLVLVRFVSVCASSWKEMQKHCSCISCKRVAAGALSVKISRYPIFEGGYPYPRSHSFCLRLS